MTVGIPGEAAGRGSDDEERCAAGVVIFGFAEADNEQ
jgi:hypothetical protein